MRWPVSSVKSLPIMIIYHDRQVRIEIPDNLSISDMIRYAYDVGWYASSVEPVVEPVAEDEPTEAELEAIEAIAD